MVTREGVKLMYGKLKSRYPKLPDKLKEKQVDVLLKIINEECTFGILPTGSGKSLIYSIYSSDVHIIYDIFYILYLHMINRCDAYSSEVVH